MLKASPKNFSLNNIKLEIAINKIKDYVTPFHIKFPTHTYKNIN